MKALPTEIARRLVIAALVALRAILPTRPTVVVAGYPAGEGNAVETVRELARRGVQRIVWFDAPDDDYLRALGIDAAVVRVPQRSLRGLWHYLTASAVFFTHGIYALPGIDRSKITVCLWHGNGPKDGFPLFATRRGRRAPADHVIASSRLWGEHLADVAPVPRSGLIVSGLPRNDQLERPCSVHALRQLGIDGPFVVWMPTYRREVADLEACETDIAAAARLGAAQLARAGVQMVVKAHPYDDVCRDLPGAVSVSDEQLIEAGVSLYSLLGASQGLITDASSVWLDYLVLDRPVGFLFPDRAEYRVARPLYPDDVLDWLPGPYLDDLEGWRAYAADVVSGGIASRGSRVAVVDRAGLVVRSGAAERMLDAVVAAHPASRFAGLVDHSPVTVTAPTMAPVPRLRPVSTMDVEPSDGICPEVEQERAVAQ